MPRWIRRSTPLAAAPTGNSLTLWKALTQKPSSGRACVLWRRDGKRDPVRSPSAHRPWRHAEARVAQQEMKWGFCRNSGWVSVTLSSVTSTLTHDAAADESRCIQPGKLFFFSSAVALMQTSNRTRVLGFNHHQILTYSSRCRLFFWGVSLNNHIPAHICGFYVSSITWFTHSLTFRLHSSH